MDQLLQSPVFLAFVAGIITMLFTGLGALPVLFFNKIPRSVLGPAYGLAGGMMVSVSAFDLFMPGLREGKVLHIVFGALVGGLCFRVASQWIDKREWKVGNITGAGARRVVLIVGVMLLHSFPEGLAIGVGYGSMEAEHSGQRAKFRDPRMS